MAHFFTQLKPTTAGERLYRRIAGLGMQDLRLGRLSEQKFVRLTGRGEIFGNYLEGSTIAFAFRRVMKAAYGIYRDKEADTTRCNARLTSLLSEWFSWLEKEDISVLMRDALRAHDASHKAIPKSIETEVWHSRSAHRCCFCGDVMRSGSGSFVKDSKGKKATLEHVWPSSLGGDSVIENLVPSCSCCNTAKSDLSTWEEGAIHEFVYPIDFQLSDYFHRTPVAQRILLQRRAVMALASRDHITLKQALLRIGPYGELKAMDAEDTWDIFNTQNHFVSLGELLW